MYEPPSSLHKTKHFQLQPLSIWMSYRSNVLLTVLYHSIKTQDHKTDCRITN